MSKIYYVDPQNGLDSNSGLSQACPKQNYLSISVEAGDSVLFRRGSVIKGILRMANGTKECPTTYGAYGEGKKPIFWGSEDISASADWTEEAEHLWVYSKRLPREVGNLIFNNRESCGKLRWHIEELDEQGEWYYSHFGEKETKDDGQIRKLYLYSERNPGEYYQKIEAAMNYIRMAGGLKDDAPLTYVIMENLSFENGGIHGFQSWNSHDLIIRNCDFRYIGGAVWSEELKIRFGNGIEFWNSSNDILIEGCVFEEIYDSCITHQGGPSCLPSERINMRNNLFVKYGMAAYEVRDRMPIDTHFDNNICINAGGGYTMQGEMPPRQSEIYPQPMGHHIFLWRIEHPTEGGRLTISNNIFYEAPYGGAIYSIISPEAEKQMMMEHNCYYKSEDDLFWKLGGKTYTLGEFARYQKESGMDKTSIVAAPQFADASNGNYTVADSSVCAKMNIGGKTSIL